MTGRGRRLSGVAVVVLFLLAGSVRAEESLLPKGFTIHGFLTQAIAWGGDVQYFGIPAHDHTTDLRKAALQFRFEPHPGDAFVLQLSHERWGVSPIAQARSQDVYLDWGFYQHTFANGLWFKTGRVTIPFGVWNEVRDVGTILPFYRLSYGIYGEGQYGVETIDGAVAGDSMAMGDYEVEWSLYFGESKQLQYDLATDIELHDTRGGQVWLDTPWHELRAGVGLWAAEGRNSLTGVGADGREHYLVGVASLDATFGPVRTIVEYADYDYESGPYHAYSGLVRWSVTEQLTLNLAYETADYTYDDLVDPSLPSDDYDPYDRDFTVGVGWAFRPDVVLRIEHHRYKGYTVEVDDPEAAGPFETNFTILSISTSF